VTRLAVHTAEALVDGVIAVHASGHSESAFAYRARLGITGPPMVAVVVQLMIAADCAGVMFTRCPLSGQDVRVIEGAWGLGESVVSGLVEPDRFRLQRGGQVIERAVADKPIAIRARATGDTHEVAVSESLRRAACLDDDKLRMLDELATRCDGVFPDGAHDIEWAFERDCVALLQRRRITRTGRA
jgi:pyruvate, water dikinase